MKLDGNELTRKQNILVVLFILVFFFGGFYLQQFIGEFAALVSISGIAGTSFWIIHVRSKNRERLRSSVTRTNGK